MKVSIALPSVTSVTVVSIAFTDTEAAVSVEIKTGNHTLSSVSLTIRNGESESLRFNGRSPSINGVMTKVGIVTPDGFKNLRDVFMFAGSLADCEQKGIRDGWLPEPTEAD